MVCSLDVPCCVNKVLCFFRLGPVVFPASGRGVCGCCDCVVVDEECGIHAGVLCTKELCAKKNGCCVVEENNGGIEWCCEDYASGKGFFFSHACVCGGVECLKHVRADSEFVVECRAAVFFVLCINFEVFKCSLPVFLADADFFLGAVVCEKKVIVCPIFFIGDAHPRVWRATIHDFCVRSIDAECPTFDVAAVCKVCAVADSLEHVFVAN